MRWWKVLGVAAFIGVAATGVLFERTERVHRDYTPEEIREHLRARVAEAHGDEPVVAVPTAPPRRTARLAEAGRRVRITLGEAGTRFGLRLRPTRRRG